MLAGANGFVAVLGMSDTKKHATRWVRGGEGCFLAVTEQARQLVTNEGAERVSFSLASFLPGDDKKLKRRADRAVAFRAYCADIDFHDLDGDALWVALAETRKSLFDLLAPYGLKPTSLVYTGKGYQVYWEFKEDCPVKLWEEVSAYLGSILVALGFNVDHGVQGDRGRIMRVPGTPMARMSGNAYFTDKDPNLYNAVELRNKARKLCERSGWVPLYKTIRITTAVSSYRNSEIAQCGENEKRLKKLLDILPPIIPHTNSSISYAIWRNCVWAIKKTGLAGAWDRAVEWARGASKQYDDWFEALSQVWEADREGGAVSVGSLFWAAQEYGRNKQGRTWAGRAFFLSNEEAALFVTPLQYTDVGIEGEPSHDSFDAYEFEGEPCYDSWENCEFEDEFMPDQDFNPDLYSEIEPDVFPDHELDCEPEYFLYIDRYEDTEDDDYVESRFDDESEPDIFYNLPEYRDDSPDFTDKEDEEEERFDEELPTSYERDELRPSPPQVFAYQKVELIRQGIGYPDDRYLPGGLAWDNRNRLCLKNKNSKKGDEPDLDMGLVPVLDTALEYLGTNMSRENTAMEVSHGSHVFNVYSLEKTAIRVEIPAEFVGNGERLKERILGAGGSISEGPKIGEKLVSLVKRLIDSRAGRFDLGRRESVKQAGWVRDSKDTFSTFVLGPEHSIAKHGAVPGAVLDAKSHAWLNGFGEVKGDAYSQAAGLDFYTGMSRGHSIARAYLCYSLGCVLGEFLGVNHATPYLYGSAGVGKTTTVMMGLSFWGNPRGIISTNQDTRASLEQKMTAYGPLPILIDDVEKNARLSFQDIKSIILNATQGKEGAASNSTGTGLVRGTRVRHTALTISSNTPPYALDMEDDAQSGARYRRMLPTRWEGMQLTPEQKLRIDGIENHIHSHYGHIGPLFVQWFLDNFDAALGWLKVMHKQEQDYEERRKSYSASPTFQIATRACMQFAGWWLVESGIAKGWNPDIVKSDIHEFGRDGEVVSTSWGDSKYATVWAEALKRTVGHTLVIPQSGSVNSFDLPPELRRSRVQLRVEHKTGFAFIDTELIRTCAIAKGVDDKEMRRFVVEKLGGNPRVIPKNLTKGTCLSITRADTYRVPISQVMEE